jgi:hypothetical protein
MPMNMPTIAQWTQTTTLLISIGWMTGCSQTVTPPAEAPIVAPSVASSVASPVTPPEPSPEPSTAPAAPKPVRAKSLVASEKSPKEQDKATPRTAAKPIENRALLFSCATDNGKEILLYQTDETIDYSFGDPGTKPELDLKVPRDQASTWQWKGVGRAMTYAVDVPNGNVSYSVFWSVDRLSETKAVEAGVRVHGDRKTLATVYCTSKIVSNLQGVQLKPTEY